MDAGDLLPAALDAPPGYLPPDPGEVDRRLKLLLTSLARIGVTAFAPGESDLFIGAARLRALAQKAKVPVVSANLVDEKGHRYFDADRIVVAAGLKVGIFGILVPTAADRQKLRNQGGVIVTDATEAAGAAVASLRQRGAQLVVGLFHLAGGADEARQIVAKVGAIDFVVLGHGGTGLQSPAVAGQTRIVEAYEMGKNLGRLDLHVINGGLAFVDRGRRAQLQVTLDNHRHQIESYQTRLADGRDPAVRDFYTDQIKSLQATVVQEKKELSESPVGASGNESWMDNRIFELGPDIPAHPGLTILVDRYNEETNRRGQLGLPVGLGISPADSTATGAGSARTGKSSARKAGAVPDPPPEDWTYGSNGACALCHQPQMAHWKTTAHAHALETLRKKGRDKDPECISCHTTGYFRPGGTHYTKTATTFFADVGCESCHGPSVLHVRAQNKTGTIRNVGPKVCLECHTPDQTNGEFDYARYLRAVLGPGHGMPAAKAP